MKEIAYLSVFHELYSEEELKKFVKDQISNTDNIIIDSVEKRGPKLIFVHYRFLLPGQLQLVKAA